MIQLYDEALYDYLHAFNADISIVPVSDYWRVIAMHKEGKLELPAICVSRTSSTPDSELKSWVLERKGRMDRVQDHRRITEQTIPLTLQYNLTCLATTQDDIDELTSELIFLVINQPKVTIKIPYGSERYTNAQISISGEIQDASVRDNFSETGILYQTITPVRLRGAGIFNIEKRNLRYLQWSVEPIINTIKEEIEDAQN